MEHDYVHIEADEEGLGKCVVHGLAGGALILGILWRMRNEGNVLPSPETPAPRIAMEEIQQALCQQQGG
ncbi:hypothetical protein PIB30_056880 [Stylosanthes scabra]|uniref:Uncharacterized protein n=1 Tax=Stylosanthes scabra TaxID=79078 RepID=A0ABU6VJR3_9FABA|nr:hypothetical protein [Stylosanthes scabra]